MNVISYCLYKNILLVIISCNVSYCGFSVFKVLDCVVRLFHVKRLLREVVSLPLIPEGDNNNKVGPLEW